MRIQRRVLSLQLQTFALTHMLISLTFCNFLRKATPILLQVQAQEQQLQEEQTYKYYATKGAASTGYGVGAATATGTEGHGEATLSKRMWACTSDPSLQPPSHLKSLEDLRNVLVGDANDSVPFAPQIYDASGSFENGIDPQPYDYAGFRIRPIFYEGLPYDHHDHGYSSSATGNACTLVFAWLSTPIDLSRKVPGTVLLHGGGGTSFPKWCEHWALEGFASISMGLEGQTSEKRVNKQEKDGVIVPELLDQFADTPIPGPKRHGIFGDFELPLDKQWLFHAMASSMMANTLLRNENTVIPSEVGIAGCSWGGVLTTTLLPYEHSRYAFASIGYGTGSLTERPYDENKETRGSEAHIGKVLNEHYDEDSVGEDTMLNVKYRMRHDFYEKTWDPSPKLKDVMIPTLWISGNTDFHFSLRAQKLTYDSLHPHAPKWLAIVNNLGHLTPWLYKRPEHYEFAKSVISSLQAQKHVEERSQIPSDTSYLQQPPVEPSSSSLQPLTVAAAQYGNTMDPSREVKGPETETETTYTSLRGAAVPVTTPNEEYSNINHGQRLLSGFKLDPYKIKLTGMVARSEMHKEKVNVVAVSNAGGSFETAIEYTVTYRLFKPLMKVSLLYSTEKPFLDTDSEVKPRQWNEITFQLKQPTDESQIYNSEFQIDQTFKYTDISESLPEFGPNLKVIEDATMINGQDVSFLTGKDSSNTIEPGTSMRIVRKGCHGEMPSGACFWMISVTLPSKVQSWYVNAHLSVLEEHDYVSTHAQASHMGTTADIIVSSPYHDVTDDNHHNYHVTYQH